MRVWMRVVVIVMVVTGVGVSRHPRLDLVDDLPRQLSKRD
jgi:hypothetical protein